MNGLRVLLAVAVTGCCVLVGCGSTSGPPSMGSSSPLEGLLTVGPYPSGDQYYRYRDVVDHPFGPTYNPGDGGDNSWYAGDQVAVTYDLDIGTTLVGTVTADGVKPNSAYQVKLEGKPTTTYGECASAPPDDAPNWSNIRLGSVGRWWCLGAPEVHDPWNVTDAELASGAHDDHVVLGYLLFDFFVTDNTGSVVQPLYLDSSFHVLWRTDQRRANPVKDGKPRAYDIIHNPTFYEAPFTTTTASVYAEGETGRPRPGQVTLPAGHYDCRLLLTEESFHNSPPEVNWPYALTLYADGGFWAHAMTEETFIFDIAGEEPPPPPPGLMHVADIAMSLQRRGPLTNAVATVTVVDANGTPVEGVTVDGAWSGLVSGSDSGLTDSSGEVSLASAKTRSSGTFTFSVTNLAKTGWTYDPSANVETSDSISSSG